MSAAIRIRQDFDAAALRRLATTVKDAGQVRRLLALAAVYDGQSREEAARIGGMDRQTLRDWVLRFNERGPDGLINVKAPGRPPTLSKAHTSDGGERCGNAGTRFRQARLREASASEPPMKCRKRIRRCQNRG